MVAKHVLSPAAPPLAGQVGVVAGGNRNAGKTDGLDEPSNTGVPEHCGHVRDLDNFFSKRADQRPKLVSLLRRFHTDWFAVLCSGGGLSPEVWLDKATLAL